MLERVSVMHDVPWVFVDSDRICEKPHLLAQMTYNVSVIVEVSDPAYHGAPGAPLIKVRRLKAKLRYASFDGTRDDAILATKGGWIIKFGPKDDTDPLKYAKAQADAEAFARDWEPVIARRRETTRRLRSGGAVTTREKVPTAV